MADMNQRANVSDRRKRSAVSPFVLAVCGLMFWAPAALSQTREDEEFCFNANQEKVLMMAGAKDASLADWPFIGGLRQREQVDVEQYTCAGTFLSPTWFLTAAHCVADEHGAFSPKLDNAGTPRFSVSQSPDQHFRDADKTAVGVKRIELPPDFTTGVRDNAQFANHDVALLKLSAAFKFAQKDVYFPIPTTEHFERSWVWPNRCVSVAGWGFTLEGLMGGIPVQNSPSVLQAMNILVWDDADCSKSEFWPKKNSDQFCAGYKTLRKNSCHGDSGGPLVIRDSPTGFALIGVLTAGPPRACPGDRPNLYTRVSVHRDWINKVMSQDPH
jgi:secreted trypsin-like serine protease